MNTDSRLFTADTPRLTIERGLFDPHGDLDAANVRMARAIGHKLAQVFPGHPWAVSSEIEHGIVKISLQGFTQWPMIVKIQTLKSDPGLKTVVRYAGELLERLNMPRKGFSLADWKAASAARPWHFYRNRKAPE